MSGVANGVTEVPGWDLNKRWAATKVGVIQDHAGRKGVKALLLVNHESTLAGEPRDFGLRTGDRGNRVDGARVCRRPAQPTMDYWKEPGV